MIETERLVLHTLPPSLVALLVARDWEGARATDPPYEITAETFADDAVTLAHRLVQLTADPTAEPWLYRVGVLRGTRQVVGRVGLHAPPAGDGMIEIGYSVATAYRRQGFALEMARGLIAWGAAHGAAYCLASVRPDNVGSLATIARMGFVRIGEQIDEIDGLEWVHRLDLG